MALDFEQIVIQKSRGTFNMLTIVITSSETKDLWDSCNQWGVVNDVYIAAKISKSGHRFGFVRFKNVNDVNLLVSNLTGTWMGGFHLFADEAKYGRTNNRLEERSGNIKPNEGMNTQLVRDNANVFQSFNSYAKAVLGNKSVGVSSNNDASNSGEKPVKVSVSNKANEESSNEAWMFISEDDCIDLNGIERSILAKVKDLSVITDLLKYMSSEGFVDVGLRYVGGRWVWLEFDSTDQVESVKNSKESFKVSYRNRSYCITATEFAYWPPNIESTEDKSMTDSLERKDDEGPSLDGGLEHEEPLDVDNCDSVSSKDDNNDSDSDSSSEMLSTSRLMREVDVRGVDSDHEDSFEEGEIIGDSVLKNDGCVKDCMKKNLDDDVEKDIEDCSKNVTEKCEVVNNNMSNNVKCEILEDHFDAHHNNGLDDLDISLRNGLLHQDKCWVRTVKAAVNDSSIVSPSTPSGTVLNLAEESCSTWLDYVGPLITDELDSEKH
uniref:RRM domain-containing protein n=1 Tax=Tanacetum cinerariifolium TaxID=118510 RepID=A0A699J1R5_TANCI|nr:hypothetical protein [Tanacetum cinerariifolium]